MPFKQADRRTGGAAARRPSTLAALVAGSALAAVGWTPLAVAQDDISPAVVFDMGGKFDKSFNQGVYDGVERFKEESGTDYREFEVTNETQREQAIRRMAQRGADPILGIGFAQADPLAAVAADFPDTRFTLIDGVVDLPNVQSIVFKEHEGSFLVGMLAAMASESGQVGFVGGMDIPLIRRFACGYEQGVKHANASTDVIQNMTGTTPAAWNDPGRGSELAKGQFDRGVDVIYAAAGGTGVGVYQAAADGEELAIGVDSNQNYLHPGTMLTSMLKRVDNAAYETFQSAADGTWEPGVKVLGLAEDGVGYAVDEFNEDLVTEDMRSAVEEAKAQIVSGELEVHDYMSDNTCSY